MPDKPEKMVAVFSFDEPEDPVTMAVIIQTLKEQFQNLTDVKVHLAKARAAAYIMEFFQTGLETRSPLVEHAKRELMLLNNDADFNESIVKAISGFVSYGHSGGSAEYGIRVLMDLLENKNLSPLTNDLKEWREVGPLMWQSTRNSKAFSENAGRTYYLVDEEPRVHYESEIKPPPDKEEGN